MKKGIVAALGILIVAGVMGGCVASNDAAPLAPAPSAAPTNIVGKGEVTGRATKDQYIAPYDRDIARLGVDGSVQIDRSTCRSANPADCYGVSTYIRSKEYNPNETSDAGRYVTGTQGAVPFELTVALTTGGYSSTIITVETGQVLTFKNEDIAEHWPYSPALMALDSGRALTNGKTYSYRFSKPGIYPLADKLYEYGKATVYVR